MLHIDTDLYEPARISLESFFPYMVHGGIIFFHDYGDGHWPGIKIIVDELMDSGVSVHIFDSSDLFSALAVVGITNVEDYIEYIR